MSKERPILFNGPMVKAILDGRKTQTRRTINPQPLLNYRPELYRTETDKFGCAKWRYDDNGTKDTIAYVQGPDEPSYIQCPHGAPGDRLWVRETFYTFEGPGSFARFKTGRVWYQADGLKTFKWKPSIFMPRLFLAWPRGSIGPLQTIIK